MDDDQTIRTTDDLENDVRNSGPKTREELVQEAWQSGAPSSVKAAVERLPEGEYYNANQLDDALKTGRGPQDETTEETS